MFTNHGALFPKSSNHISLTGQYGGTTDKGWCEFGTKSHHTPGCGNSYVEQCDTRALTPGGNSHTTIIG